MPALMGGALVFLLLRRALPLRRAATLVAGFAIVALLATTPCYVRNAVDTGNPIYPFGFQVFGGRHWSAAASEYLADYYRQYQSTYATRRDGEPYAGLAVARFPWDLPMHPESFENAARATLDVSPFMLAFAPALVLVRRRRARVLAVAGLGFAYAAIISTGAWAHPRYVLPGVALLLAATVPAASLLFGRRLAACLWAAEQGWLREFKHALYEAFFCEGEDIATDEEIARGAGRAGLDPEGAVEAAYSSARFARIREIRAEAEAVGVRGVPSLVADDGSTHWGTGGIERLLSGAPLVPRA